MYDRLLPNVSRKRKSKSPDRKKDAKSPSPSPDKECSPSPAEEKSKSRWQIDFSSHHADSLACLVLYMYNNWQLPLHKCL